MDASYSSGKEPILIFDIRGHHIPALQLLLDPQIFGSLYLSGFDEKGNFKKPLNGLTEVFFPDESSGKVDPYKAFEMYAKILTDSLDVTFPDMNPPIKPKVRFKDIGDNKVHIKIVSDSLDSICQICREPKPVCTANTAGKDMQAIAYYGLEVDKVYASGEIMRKIEEARKNGPSAKTIAEELGDPYFLSKYKKQ